MSSLDNLKILERTRPSIIFAAIVLRKPTIMARQDWKHEPWVLHPERIDSLKLLFDIIADFPQVYVTREHFLSSLKSGDTYDTMSGLLRRCHQILSNLEQWERQWAYSPSHAPREVDARPTTPFVTDVDGIVRPAWSTILHYQSLYHATAMTVFKGALILALQLTDWLQAYLEEPAEHRSARKERITAAGLFICRSVDFHQEDRWGEQGNFNILFPLRLAFQAVGENNPGIGVWISGVLRDISTGKRGTWRSARSVLNIGYTDSSALDVTP